MTGNSKLGLIVAYYLSRFDDSYKNLGYSTFTEATREIGKILDLKPRTLQNFRDELDPWLQTTRAGWHKKKLVGSRRKVIETLQDLTQHALRGVIDEILETPGFRSSQECAALLSLLSDKEDGKSRKGIYVSRGPTGNKAEMFFVEHFTKSGEPVNGTLLDRRLDGCGYDFEIEGKDGRYYLDVKGLAGDEGGISLTDKEWEIAQLRGRNYILALVTRVEAVPEISFIFDPARVFFPKRSVRITMNVTWPISQKDIKLHLNSQKGISLNIHLRPGG
jgi:hypothetical protein